MDANQIEEIMKKFGREYFKGRVCWIEGVDHPVVIEGLETGQVAAPPPPPPKPAPAPAAAAGAAPAAAAPAPTPPAPPAAPAAPAMQPAIVVLHKRYAPKEPLHTLPRGAPGAVTLPKTYEKVPVTFKAI
jgi:hypothetical protein